jgi:hypothetical protein
MSLFVCLPTISMAIFNSKLLVNQRGNHQTLPLNPIKTPLNLIKSHWTYGNQRVTSSNYDHVPQSSAKSPIRWVIEDIRRAKAMWPSTVHCFLDAIWVERLDFMYEHVQEIIKHMYMYYIYIYIFMFFLNIYIYMHKCIYICTHKCIYIYICTYMKHVVLFRAFL